MNKKIISFGIVSLFLLTSLSMTVMGKNVTGIDACEKPTALIQNIRTIEITVECDNDYEMLGHINPEEIDTTITITNTATDEIIVLTNEDIAWCHNLWGYQVYFVELNDGNYNIACSIELPKPWKSTEKYKEWDTSVPLPPGWGSIYFMFDSEIRIRSHSRVLNIQSLFINRLSQRFPLLQQLLNL